MSGENQRFGLSEVGILVPQEYVRPAASRGGINIDVSPSINVNGIGGNVELGAGGGAGMPTGGSSVVGGSTGSLSSMPTSPAPVPAAPVPAAPGTAPAGQTTAGSALAGSELGRPTSNLADAPEEDTLAQGSREQSDTKPVADDTKAGQNKVMSTAGSEKAGKKTENRASSAGGVNQQQDTPNEKSQSPSEVSASKPGKISAATSPAKVQAKLGEGIDLNVQRLERVNNEITKLNKSGAVKEAKEEIAAAKQRIQKILKDPLAHSGKLAHRIAAQQALIDSQKVIVERFERLEKLAGALNSKITSHQGKLAGHLGVDLTKTSTVTAGSAVATVESAAEKAAVNATEKAGSAFWSGVRTKIAGGFKNTAEFIVSNTKNAKNAITGKAAGNKLLLATGLAAGIGGAAAMFFGGANRRPEPAPEQPMMMPQAPMMPEYPQDPNYWQNRVASGAPQVSLASQPVPADYQARMMAQASPADGIPNLSA